MTHLFTVFLLLFTIFKINKSSESWKEKYNSLEYEDTDEKCADSEICTNIINEPNKRRQHKDIEEQGISNEVTGKSPRLMIPFYHSSRPVSCSCGIEFRVLDLGHQYYPRYLHTGVCKSDICGGLYRCVEKHYKIRVLKQRDPRNPEVKSVSTLPETLKSVWQPELVTVTVACECSL